MADFLAAPFDDARRHFGLGFDASARAAPEFDMSAGNSPWLMIARALA
jgi:hypothetical protein